jgi:Rieske Fe-S protein
MTRRNFIVWYLAGLMTAMAVAAIAPLLVYIWPTGSKVKPATLKITLSTALEQLAEGTVVKFNAPSNYGFKMIDGGGDNYPGKVSFGGFIVHTGSELIGLSITCAHLGCSVAFQKQQKYFLCPCHGSHYAIDGRVTKGPATANLSHYGWKKGAAPNQILVEGYSLQGIG